VPGLTFLVEAAEAIPFAASPTIAFRLRVASERVQSVALRCQIQIEAQRRRYTPAERRGLRDLFGEPDRWSQTLRPLLWTHASTTVPEFSGSIAIDLPVACTFDFNVAAAKYFHAMEDEDVPLVFQFSGTIFYTAADGTMRIGQIAWDNEARFRLPACVWREMMDLYYPNSAWLRLSRDAFERLDDYKQSHGIATWEQAIESLLPGLRKQAAS
jgi:Family of unknown function (DUF6084)